MGLGDSKKDESVEVKQEVVAQNNQRASDGGILDNLQPVSVDNESEPDDDEAENSQPIESQPLEQAYKLPPSGSH